MKESELFLPVKQCLLDKLGCTEVYAEVIDIDVVGIKGSYDVAVELKTSLNWKVIEQAIERSRIADYTYIGVPHSETINYVALDTVKRYNLGLITVGKSGRAQVILHAPKVETLRKGKKIRDYVEEVHSLTTGGVKTGEGPTRYSHTIDKIKAYMKDRDWVTAQQLAYDVPTHYKGRNVAGSIKDTLEASWNKDWCERKKEGNRVYFRMKKSKS